jgi:hypothetical protein
VLSVARKNGTTRVHATWTLLDDARFLDAMVARLRQEG